MAIVNIDTEKKKILQIVEGIYLRDLSKERELHYLCRSYYDDHSTKFGKLGEAGLKNLFKSSLAELISQVIKRKIYVEDGELMGKDGEPLKSKLTTYFWGIVLNKFYEMLRELTPVGRSLTGIDVKDTQAEMPNSSTPYVQDGFWFVDGKSTKVKYSTDEDKLYRTYHIPYIGKDGHWMIGEGDKAQDLGAVTYDNIFYDDKEIRELAVVANRIAKMKGNCKKILTLFYYLERNYDEIMEIMPNFESKKALKTAKYKCLKNLIDSVKGTYC